MIEPKKLFEIFKKNGLTFFSGVPDSTFKGWMSFLESGDSKKSLKNIISVNECEATAVCAGYHLSTGNVAVLYMQNSGLGKCVNPLTSLCDREVYSIPVLLVIGWRGEPGKHDEPQHKKMGRITLGLLDVLEIPYEILSENEEEAERTVEKMKRTAEQEKRPVAIIIKEGVVGDYKVGGEIKSKEEYEMTKEEAIKIILENIVDNSVVLSTTGKTSRELFECRVARKEEPKDFYTVGSMGCSASIANAIALEKKEKKIFVFDGDGAILMQLGSMATIGHYKAKNLYHIVFDNGAYDSTGGQPTVSDTVNFEQIAKACGYESTRLIRTLDEINQMKEITKNDGPILIVIKVKKGSRKDLGRPTKTPIENKTSFMNFLRT
jgi:phosphonopyruvate decarboxylase